MPSFRYPNKRMGTRGPGGRFAKMTLADLGAEALVCPNPECQQIVFYDLFIDHRPESSFVERAKPPEVCPECSTPLRGGAPA